MAPESHEMWARPYEMGYDVASEIVGTASATQVLLLFSFGDDPDNFVMGFIPGNNPLVKNAAANAVEKADADGIYVTRVNVEKKGLWPFYWSRSATVHGRALRLKPLGEVSQERADEMRKAARCAASGCGTRAVIVK